jgi:hypothetical protein
VQYHLSVLNHHILWVFEEFDPKYWQTKPYFTMLTTNVTRQDRLFLRLTGPKMVSTCEKSISKRVFTSIWLTHISFSLLSFKITGKQAWFWFLCYQTRHQNFRWKHGYFIEFSILRRFVHCTFTVAMYEYHWKIIYVQNTPNSCYNGGCYQTRHKY